MAKLPLLPGRDSACEPSPPMIRTCPIQAYGSTVIKAFNTALTHNFATLQALLDIVDYLRSR